MVSSHALIKYIYVLGHHNFELKSLSPTSPQFTGPWNLVVVTLKLHPFHIYHLFSNVKWRLPYLNFDFYHTYPLKEIDKHCCEMWNRNEACPTTLFMKSGHGFKLKVVRALTYMISWLLLYEANFDHVIMRLYLR